MTKLNVNIPRSIAEFQTAMKQFMVRRILYKIIFRGKGLEFESYRYFNPDDDASLIDWKASMRANRLLVKQYIEERDLKILFVVDIGENMVFGSTEKLKCEYATEVVAALSHLIIVSGDKIGFALANKDIAEIAMPVPGMSRFNILVDFLTNASLYKGSLDMEKTLNFLLEYLDRSISAVFIVSDFLNFKKTPNAQRILDSLSNRFETVALIVRDPLDYTLPKINRPVVVQDPKTGNLMTINPAIARARYEQNAREQEEALYKMFEQAGVDYLKLTTDKHFVMPLVNFLKNRIERRKFIVPRR